MIMYIVKAEGMPDEMDDLNLPGLRSGSLHKTGDSPPSPRTGKPVHCRRFSASRFNSISVKFYTPHEGGGRVIPEDDQQFHPDDR